MAVATTNLERSSPIKNSPMVVAALAIRGQIESTQTSGTKQLMVRIRAERTTSSRWTITVSELRERAVTIRPKVLTWAPAPPDRVTASLTATLWSKTLLRLLKSGDQAVASS